jgi:hypothetical protein
MTITGESAGKEEPLTHADAEFTSGGSTPVSLAYSLPAKKGETKLVFRAIHPSSGLPAVQETRYVTLPEQLLSIFGETAWYTTEPKIFLECAVALGSLDIPGASLKIRFPGESHKAPDMIVPLSSRKQAISIETSRLGQGRHRMEVDLLDAGKHLVETRGIVLTISPPPFL